MPAPATPSDQLLHLLPDVVLQTDALWVITYLNPAWHKVTGHPVEGTLGSSLLDVVHPDDRGTLRSGMPVFRLRFANGDYRWVRLQLRADCDATDRVLSRQGMLVEITEITEQVLIEIRQRFLRLLETIDGVVWEAERGVGNTFLSPQVERLFGYTVEEWRSDPGFWRARVHPDDFPEAHAIDEAAYRATHSYAYMITRTNGEEYRKRPVRHRHRDQPGQVRPLAATAWKARPDANGAVSSDHRPGRPRSRRRPISGISGDSPKFSSLAAR